MYPIITAIVAAVTAVTAVARSSVLAHIRVLYEWALSCTSPGLLVTTQPPAKQLDSCAAGVATAVSLCHVRVTARRPCTANNTKTEEWRASSGNSRKRRARQKQRTISLLAFPPITVILPRRNVCIYLLPCCEVILELVGSLLDLSLPSSNRSLFRLLEYWLIILLLL
jgi:hypothetical protein